jgi:DNA-binding LacI/PurR family transcriptional regulator
VRARLSDIAQQADVSEATVSRVLNDRPGVSPDKRQAVLTALDVLGYERPQRLRKRSAGLVGLVVPELENPIFPAFAQTIESALAHRGFTPVLCTQTPGGVTEDEYVEMLLRRLRALLHADHQLEQQGRGAGLRAAQPRHAHGRSPARVRVVPVNTGPATALLQLSR